jgi:heme A synthase
MRRAEKPEVISSVATVLIAVVALLVVRGMFSFILNHLLLSSVIAGAIVALLGFVVYASRAKDRDPLG